MRLVTWMMVGLLLPRPGLLDGHPQQDQAGVPKRSDSISVIHGPDKPHGHAPETADGTPPCGYGMAKCRSQQPSTPHENHTGRNVAIGVGVGVLAGVVLGKIAASHRANHVETLSEKGPQYPDLLHMSRFQVTGFVRGNWPLVVDYGTEAGTYAVLTIVAEGSAPVSAVLPTTLTGRTLVKLLLPASLGSSLKIADFTIRATVSHSDQHLRYFRVYGFGCGARAVGSVAIDQLKFSPGVVTASHSETQFGFHAHTSFDRVKAEFMQLEFVDQCMENKMFDAKPINRRLQENDSIQDTWNANKAHPGQIQFRVRGWMTKEAGGDWVSAFSPDLVLRQ